MNPLKTEQNVLRWLFICAPTHNTGQLRKIAYAVFSVSVLIAISCNVLASVAYFRKFVASNFEASLDAVHPGALFQKLLNSIRMSTRTKIYKVFPVFGWMPLILIFIEMQLSKHRITKILNTLSNIYEERKFCALKSINDQSFIPKTYL